MFTECIQFKRTCSSNLGHCCRPLDMSCDDEATFRQAARFRKHKAEESGAIRL